MSFSRDVNETLHAVANGHGWFIKPEHREAVTEGLKELKRLQRELNQVKDRVTAAEENEKKAITDRDRTSKQHNTVVERVRSEYKTLEAQYARLKKDFEAARKGIEAQAFESDKVREQLEQVVTERDNALVNVEAHKIELNDVKNDLKFFEDAANRLKNETLLLRQEADVEYADHSEALKVQADMLRSHAELQYQLNQAQSELESTKQEVGRQLQEREKLDVALKGAEAEVESLRRELASVSIKAVQAEGEAQTAKDRAKVEIDVLIAHLQTVKNELP